MKQLRACVLGVLVTGYSCLLVASAASLSAPVKDPIFKLRLDAARFASHVATSRCRWTPLTQPTFADAVAAPKGISDPLLFQGIMQMLRLDQNSRALLNALHTAQSLNLVEAADAANFPKLKHIIRTHGFPTEHEIGFGGVNGMVMLVAHADKHRSFQIQALALMREEVASGTLPSIFVGTLVSIRPGLTSSQTGNAHHPAERVASKRPGSDRGPLEVKRHSLNGRACYDEVWRDVMAAYIKEHYKGNAGS